MLFLSLFSLSLCDRIKQCTPKKTLFDVTLKDIDQVVGGSRPVFLRLIKNGCPYAKPSQANWEKAAELFPNVQFVRAECIYSPQICARFNVQISPSHAVIGPNSSTVRTFFTNPDEISKSTQYYSNVLSQNFQFYSFDTPSIEDLIPQNTNNFFESAPYSVFLLYDSNCYEDLDLIATWLTKVTDGKITAEEVAIGKLNCGKYPEECKKWGSNYPAANVFSREKGTSISISDFDHLQERLEQVINYLNQSNQTYPTPFPNPSESEGTGTEPEIKNVNKLTLDNLQKRTVDEIKEKYLAAKKRDYTGNEYTGDPGRCSQITMNPQIINESLKHIKFFRELAGLPNHNIRNEESQNEGCYYGAKYLTYIGRLSHSVSDNYKSHCDFGSHWTELKNSLAWSNLAQSFNSNDIWTMMSGLVKDEGDNNEGVIGHRRWFLYPYLSKIGVGFYPMYKIKMGTQIMQYPATGTWRVSDGLAYQIPYTLVNFIAYPPPGPFPINELPTSWTIYYHKFQNYSENDLSKITVKLTRDDGIPLSYQKLYLSKINAGMTGTLIIKLSSKTIANINVGHGVHVQVYLLDGETRDLLDYTITFFDFSSETQLCFYQNDINKCPETISNENKLGPGEYQSFTQTGIPRTVINVVEQITLDEPLRLNYSKNIFVKGEKIVGTVIVGIGYTIDFADPTQTIVHSEMDPYEFKSGVFKTSRYPKRIDIIFTKAPCARNTFRTLFYVGLYTQFTYMKRAVDGEYRYFFSITNSDMDWTFVCLSVTDFEYACMGNVGDYKNYIDQNTKCTVFKSFNELKNLKTSKKIIRVYADGQLYFSASGLADGGYHDYEIYSKDNLQFQYSDKINMRARSITVQRLEGLKYSICPSFVFRDKVYGRPRYEEALKLFPFRNLTINGFYHNMKNPYIESGFKASVQGDWTAKSYLNIASNIVLYDERLQHYFNESGYFYYKHNDGETKIPIFITDGLHDRYYFVKYYSVDLTVRFRPSPESSSKAVIFDFTKINNWSDELQSGSPVIFENYMDITIVTQTKHYFNFDYNNAQYIITHNCSRIRFLDGQNPTVGITEEPFNARLEFTGTVNADVSSDTETPAVYKAVVVRFDKSVKGTNTRFASTTYYDCRPTMKNVTLGPENIIVDSIVKCINSTLYGKYEFRYAKGTYNPLLYLQNCSFQVDSIKVVIYSDSYLTGFNSAKILESAFDENIIISGLNPETASQLLNKITIVKEDDVKITTHKAILTKDSKGILIVQSSFLASNAPNVPSKYDPENYGNEDRIEDEFYILNDENIANNDDESGDFVQHFELNPPPPPAPTSSPSISPLPTETPTSSPSISSLPTETPTSSPSKVTENPPTPEVTLIFVEELNPPEVIMDNVPIESITETNEGDKDYILINTSKIENVKDSVRYETKLDSSTSNIIVDNTKNIDYQLTITDKDHEIKVSTSKASSNVLIHGEEGCNLKLENSESMEFSGQGTFKLNSAKEEEESLTISKLLPTGPITLETNKGLVINDARIFGKVTINANSSKNAEYKIKNIKLEQGCTLESSNVKLINVDVGIGASIGYHNSNFSESNFKIYYNKLSNLKQYPLNINSLDELKNIPKSISVVSKELGTTLSNDKVIIAHKEFNQPSASEKEVKNICNNWAEKFVAAENEFNALSCDTSSNGKGDVASITLFAYKREDKNGGSEKKKSPSIALIVGIVAAVVVIAVIVGVVVIYLKHKKRYEKSTDGAELPNFDEKEDTAEAATPEAKDEL